MNQKICKTVKTLAYIIFDMTPADIHLLLTVTVLKQGKEGKVRTRVVHIGRKKRGKSFINNKKGKQSCLP